LLAASGAIPIKSAEQFDELQEDVQAVCPTSSEGADWKSQSQLQSQSQIQMQGSSIDLDTRSREITQIASSISELADLFRDLGNLVVEQGTVLDSVEYNVSTTAKELHAAVEELKVAQTYVPLCPYLLISWCLGENHDSC
jgi:syntaxin 16